MFIFTLNLKSDFSKVFALIPNPSDPNNSNILPFQLFVVKSFVALTSKALTQKSLDFKYFIEVFIIETLKILMCSAPPLALLYRSLLFEGKDLSFTIIPSMPNETALRIIDPIFLGSVTPRVL